MKKYLVLVFVGMLSASAFGSSHVCAGQKLYSSNVRADFGTQPPPGKVTGSHVIMFNKQVLLSYDSVQGLFPHGVPPYQVRIEGPETVLVEQNSNAHFLKIFTAEAVLVKIDSLSGEMLEEVGRDQVVCRSEQNFVP